MSSYNSPSVCIYNAVACYLDDIAKFFRENLFWRPTRDSNPDEWFWRPLCCHYISETLLAEAVRFELTEVLLPRRVSNPVPSATRPRFLVLIYLIYRLLLVECTGIEPVMPLRRRSYSPLHHHWCVHSIFGTPYEIRTRVPAVKGRCPRPSRRTVHVWRSTGFSPVH